MENNKIDYNILTEMPGEKATKEQLERIYQRYRFARDLSGGKDVLEVACGSGLGLGYVSKLARRVVGVDIDEKNVKIGRRQYSDSDNVEVAFMDAQELSFPDNSMDLVFLFEAIYYLEDPAKFICEASRVLRPGGNLLICTVNKEWQDFHPSPFTHKYFSKLGLRKLLCDKFDNVDFFGGFPVMQNTVKDRVISLIKRMAVKFDLIPGSLKARSYLKRIFMGKLSAMPQAVNDDMAEYVEPVSLAGDNTDDEYKIIYALAQKGGNNAE